MENKQCNISEDEQSELVDLTAEYQNIILALGELQVEELSLSNQLDVIKTRQNKLKDTVVEFKGQEKLFLQRLTKKYGEGSLDTSSGIYFKH